MTEPTAELEIEQRIAILSDALKSISKNTCCDNCREAANVARAALAAYVGLARETPAELHPLPGHDETMAGLEALTIRSDEPNDANDFYARGEHMPGVTR